MKRQFTTILLLASILILFNQPVWGSVGSIMNVGALNKGSAGDTGARELINLTEKDGLLIGWAKHNIIKLVTVFAPGSGEEHIILREIIHSDGKKSISLSAPDSLTEKVRRATIYMQHQSRDLVLYEYSGEKWQERKPISITVSNTDGKKPNTDYILAFSVERLGLYWLVEDKVLDAAASTVLLDYPSASMLLGGSLFRGLLPWTWAIIFLIIGSTISFLTHISDRDRG